MPLAFASRGFLAFSTGRVVCPALADPVSLPSICVNARLPWASVSLGLVLKYGSGHLIADPLVCRNTFSEVGGCIACPSAACLAGRIWISLCFALQRSGTVVRLEWNERPARTSRDWALLESWRIVVAKWRLVRREPNVRYAVLPLAPQAIPE